MLAFKPVRARLAFGPCRPLRHALEVRHPSFVDPALVELLRNRNVALVVADTAGRWPYAEDVTADFVYARLHGDQQLYVSGYTDRALARWRDRLIAWSEGREPADGTRISDARPATRAPRDVYCYFDNDVKVKAPRDARALAARIRASGGNIVVPETAPEPGRAPLIPPARAARDSSPTFRRARASASRSAPRPRAIR